jgi:hypothetical protein
MRIDLAFDEQGQLAQSWDDVHVFQNASSGSDDHVESLGVAALPLPLRQHHSLHEVQVVSLKFDYYREIQVCTLILSFALVY